MGLFGRGDGLKIGPPGRFHVVPNEGSGIETGKPGHHVVFMSEGREAGGLPQFRVGA